MKYKACEACARSVGMVNVAGNIMMIVIKAYLGVVGGSMGLIADAVHSVADLLATFVMIFGLKLSAKQPNERYPDGYGKSEYMIAICIYIFLFFIGLFIIVNGIWVILTPPFGDEPLGYVIVVVGIVIPLLVQYDAEVLVGDLFLPVLHGRDELLVRHFGDRRRDAEKPVLY